MELHDATVTIPTRYTPWRFYPWGDAHYGSEACDEAAVKKHIKIIEEDKYGWWLGMGDITNCIGYRDSRFEGTMLKRSEEPWSLDRQWEWESDQAIEPIRPIAEKCFGVLSGNHEHTVTKHHSFNPARYVAKELKVPYLGYAASVRVMVYLKPATKKSRPSALYVLNIFAHHGWGGGRTLGSKVNRFGEGAALVVPTNADITCYGHVHSSPLCIPQAWHEVSKHGSHRIRPNMRMVVMSGTFQKTWVLGAATYSERAGYPPVIIGGPCVEVQLSRGLVKRKKVQSKITSRTARQNVILLNQVRLGNYNFNRETWNYGG